MKKNFPFSNLRLFKFFDKKGVGSLPRIFVSSIVIVTFFYISPAVINLVDKSNNESPVATNEYENEQHGTALLRQQPMIHSSLDVVKFPTAEYTEHDLLERKLAPEGLPRTQVSKSEETPMTIMFPSVTNKRESS